MKEEKVRLLFVCLGNICRSPSAEAVMKRLVKDAGLGDRIIGMDDQNITDLKRMAPDLESVAKIHRMTEFSRNKLYDHVPDPYYSGAEGFELVLDLLEDACAGLLEYCRLLRCPS